MNSETIAKMGGSWTWFGSSFVRILSKKLMNVLGILKSTKLKLFSSVVYYLLIAISAFYFTRDKSMEIFIDTKMEVSELQRNMVQALIAFIFLCI